MRIKQNVKKDKFFREVMGMTLQKFQRASSELQETTSESKRSANAKTVETAMETIKKWSELEQPDLLQWRLGCCFV